MNLEKREEGTELKDIINLEDIGDLYEMNKQELSQRSLSVLALFDIDKLRSELEKY